jgi:hypothetical protein
MSGWAVTDSRIFFGVAALVVGYVCYMMFRKRKGERPGAASRDLEL